MHECFYHVSVCVHLCVCVASRSQEGSLLDALELKLLTIVSDHMGLED